MASVNGIQTIFTQKHRGLIESFITWCHKIACSSVTTESMTLSISVEIQWERQKQSHIPCLCLATNADFSTHVQSSITEFQKHHSIFWTPKTSTWHIVENSYYLPLCSSFMVFNGQKVEWCYSKADLLERIFHELI